ncbi:MAG: phosphate ABC transporter permease PstA [Planctomycetota bacterium]
MSPANVHTSRPARAGGPRVHRERRRQKRTTSLFAHGEPMVWLTGGALALALCMVIGLLGLVLFQGLGTFWPGPLVVKHLLDGRTVAGEIAVVESYTPDQRGFEALPESARAAARARVEAQGGRASRQMIRSGNFDLTGEHFTWVSDIETEGESMPAWMLVVERQSWGRFYGSPSAFLLDGKSVASEPAEVWRCFEAHHDAVRARWKERERLKTEDIGRINARTEAARLKLRQIELTEGPSSAAALEARQSHDAIASQADADFALVRRQIEQLEQENARTALVLSTADGVDKQLGLDEIVRAYPANQLGWMGKCGVYFSRWSEFLLGEPREANSEGGVFPAIFGTVAMTLIMTIVVVPFGVLAALYLREYARPGVLVSFVRIAINNLAGVPSIVFGVFGLGFFCYIVGAHLDASFFSANLPNPTYGKGGLLWAALTLALLTLPVVIVPTEEALSAVPSSMREGSYACGATRWQTIRRIVLPRAMPGIMTGAILALARGAGEVAPLMLVGAVKLAPELPIDGTAPFVHPERSFMHLGFHIFDLGFQSQNSEAAKPMVYTTTLLLIAIVVTLNLLAIWVRARLRRRFSGVHV